MRLAIPLKSGDFSYGSVHFVPVPLPLPLPVPVPDSCLRSCVIRVP